EVPYIFFTAETQSNLCVFAVRKLRTKEQFVLHVPKHARTRVNQEAQRLRPGQANETSPKLGARSCQSKPRQTKTADFCDTQLSPKFLYPVCCERQPDHRQSKAHLESR